MEIKYDSVSIFYEEMKVIIISFEETNISFEIVKHVNNKVEIREKLFSDDNKEIGT